MEGERAGVGDGVLSIASATAAAPGAGHDRIVVVESEHGCLLAVCDGAGGTSGAAEAAEKACEFLSMGAPPEFSVRASLVDSLVWLDRHLPLLGAHGLTTCTVAFVHDGIVEGASVGDSEAWLVGADGYIDLTEGQARKPLIGSGRCRPVAFGPVPFDGTLVLGTDGLFKYCSTQRVLDVIRLHAPVEAVASLVDAVRLPTGGLQDDVAVIVCGPQGAESLAGAAAEPG